MILTKYCVFLILLYRLPLSESYNRYPGSDAPTRPLNIAHRGSSGRLPEHTMASYQLAIDEGADVIECDLCLTRDLKVICSHEAWLSDTTNVEDVYPESRMNSYFIIDQFSNITDYFSVDFTWDELLILRKRQKVSYRDPTHDDIYPLATLEELINAVNNASRPVGLHLETKDRNWVNSLDIVQDANTTFEDIVLDILEQHNYRDSGDFCFIQSFSRTSLQYMRPKTNLTLVYLTTPANRDDDESLLEIMEYADAIGAIRSQIVRTVNDRIVNRTDLVERAHDLGLSVHVWTLKNEDRHLPWDYGQDPYQEFRDYVDLEVDGIFTDFPGSLTRYLDFRFNCGDSNSNAGV